MSSFFFWTATYDCVVIFKVFLNICGCDCRMHRLCGGFIPILFSKLLRGKAWRDLLILTKHVISYNFLSDKYQCIWHIPLLFTPSHFVLLFWYGVLYSILYIVQSLLCSGKESMLTNVNHRWQDTFMVILICTTFFASENLQRHI